jgi:DNA-binding CsgD family transcriptional regulator/tetratricopeptide (TPR) repeat protein
MAVMARPSSSPRLIGRDAELADLLVAVRRPDDERRVILLDGEAGIGKTRLLSELAARLAHDAAGAVVVVRGSCLELGDGELPFAPVLEILDALSGNPDLGDEIEAVREDLSGAGPSASPSGGSSRGRLFLRVRDLLVGAAAESELAVILDDLHWADRSTLDLMVYLARRLRGTNVTLIAAYRSDELHRRHPVVPVLAELSRGFVREHVHLGPLPPEAIVEQVAAITGGADPALEKQIAERADGNPFHAEELVAVGRSATALPASLRDVLLARLAALDPPTIRLLGVCAVVGRDVDEGILQAVTDVRPETVREGLRAAVDRSVLVAAEDGRSYSFRHALLREAVHDDLLPADRVALHRRIADVLTDDPALRPTALAVAAAELARHRDLAGQPEAAFDRYLEAGRSAFRATAWAEAASAFERAGAIAAAVGDADLDERLVRDVPSASLAMYWAGDLNRAIALARTWIDRSKAVGDVATAAELLLALGSLYNFAGQEAASLAADAEAYEIPIPPERMHTRAMVAAARVNLAYRESRSQEAIALSEEALRLAEAVGDDELTIRVFIDRGGSRTLLGQMEEAEVDFQLVAQLLAREASTVALGILLTNRGWALAEIGELDAAEATLRDGLFKAVEHGTQVDWDPWNLAGLAFVAVMQGRLDETLSLADEVRATGVTYDPGFLPGFLARLATGLAAAIRGDARTARESVADAYRIADDTDEELLYVDFLAACVHGALGDADARLACVESGIARLEHKDSSSMWSELACQGASACADQAEQAIARREPEQAAEARDRARRYAVLAAEADDGRLVEAFRSTRLTRTNAMLAAAEADRADGTDDPAAWQAVADAYADLGMRPRAAEAWVHAGAAALRMNDRAAAIEALTQARRITTEVGMPVLDGRITALVRAARLELAVLDEAPARSDATAAESKKRVRAADRWGLSERELEVLALVAAGRTNGEIGRELFIATKTASVHVTHILDKLGVSNRTEAALMAVHAGVIPPAG